jgi:hypothetical protein
MLTSYLNSDPGGLCFSKPYQFPPHDGRRVERRSPQKLIYKISADNGTCVCSFSSKMLQRVLNVLHVDFAPRAPSSSACILFNKHRGGRQEQENIRGGTQGAAERASFARSRSLDTHILPPHVAPLVVAAWCGRSRQCVFWQRLVFDQQLTKRTHPACWTTLATGSVEEARELFDTSMYGVGRAPN